MKISAGLTIDKKAQDKSSLVIDLFTKLNAFIQNQHYGDGIFEFFIAWKIVNPPVGYEHFHKGFRPKFIEYKSLINRLTGEPLEIEKQFSYSIKITGEKFVNFIKVTDHESCKILANEILISLSYLDSLSKKVKDFDKEKFKNDIRQFFAEHDLI